MNKIQLIEAVALKCEISKKDATVAVTAVFEIIEDTVALGEDASIVGFGKFEKKPTKGTTGTIQFGDRKGETWTTEDSFKVGFKAGKLFDDKIKGI